MDHNLFKEQVSYFSKDYTVITVDVPWHGLSQPYNPFSLKNAAADIVNILEIEKIGSVHFVGQSMGGLIAQIIALQHPSKVKSLTVIGSAPMQPKYYKKETNLRFERFVISLFSYNFLVKSMAKKVAESKQGQDYIFEVMKQHTKSKLLEIMKKVPADALNCLNESILDTPILITYGNNDKTANIQEYCKRWAEIENRELKVIENASHNANLDNPKMFNAVLSSFLKNIKTVPNKTYKQ